MSWSTRFLSRLIGLYCLITAVSMAAHRQATLDTITALVRDPPLLWIAAIVVVISGLAIVLCHNIWSGGAVPVIVTLVGWILLIRGLVVLFLTPEGQLRLFAGFHYERLFYFYVAIAFVVGAYLTYGGFRSPPRSARRGPE